MPGPKPAHHAQRLRHAQPLQRREVARVGAPAAAAVAALVAIVVDFDGHTLRACVRLAAVVTVTVLSVSICEIRLSRRLERIESRLQARLGRSEYWQVYADVLNDLGGLGSEPTSGAPSSGGPRP